MNCRFEQELLTGYLDGELDGRDKGAVEEHIASCSECLRALGEIKSVSGSVRALPHVSAPATVAEIVRRESGSRFARMRAWFQAGIAAAALALVGISVVIVSTRPETRPESVAVIAPRSEAPAESLKKSGEKAAADDRVADQLRKSHKAEEQNFEKKLQQDKDLAERSRELREDDYNESELKRLEKEGGWGADEKKKNELGGAKGDPKAPGERPADAAPGRELAKGETKGKFKEEAEKLDNKAEPAPSENAPKPAGPAPEAATMRGKKSAEAAAVPVVVVRSAQLGKTRQDVEALLADFAKRGAKSVVGAPDVGDNAYVKDRCVTVELTEAEYEALQKLLGSMKSVEIASGSINDEKARSTEWRRRQGADRNADAEELAQAQDLQKQGGADGKGDAPPPAPAKQPAEPAKDAGAKKEMDKSKDDPSAGGGGAGFSGKPEAKEPRAGGRAVTPVARKRYILVFEDKTPPPAAPDTEKK